MHQLFYKNSKIYSRYGICKDKGPKSYIGLWALSENVEWFEERQIRRQIIIRGSNDRDVPHEHMRRKETQKYLRESCYHNIKCIASTFLTALMWIRPLNIATLATTTHRKLEEVSNGTVT